MQEYLQSTTRRVPFKAFLASDHISPATSKTIAVTISKNGASFGNPSVGATNATEIANGWYYVDLSTTDTGTLGPIVVHGAEGTIDNVDLHAQVVKATNRGATALPDAAAEASGGLFTRGAGAGQINQAANGQIDAKSVALASSLDIYTADIHVEFNGSTDEYTATWFKNGVRQTAGITSPTVQVVNRSDGSDLVASTSMTQVGSTGTYKKDEASNVIGDDASVLVIVAATIDGGSRSWSKLISKAV